MPQAHPELTTLHNKATVSYLMPSIQLPQAWHFSTALQTTLDLELLLATFSREVNAFVEHAALSFDLDEKHIHFKTARTKRHRCNYRLTLSDDFIGELRFYRERKFDAQEVTLLEQLLTALIYPLRNALLYREALQAALEDPLTGLGNRRALEQAIEREVSLSKRLGSTLALLAIDIDLFKGINDQYGHSFGDCVLQNVARALKASLRESDLSYRYGGEEFVVILNNTDPQGAELVAQRIRAAVAAADCVCNDIPVQVSVSVGVALLGDEDQRALFERADEALYEAKKAGRNCVRVAQ